MRLRLDLFARALALLWAGLWMLFFIVESWVWHTPLLMALPWVGVGLVFVLVALAACRWGAMGGIPLVAAGLSAAVGYAIWAPPAVGTASRVLSTVAFGLPPLAAGILLLASRRTGPVKA